MKRLLICADGTWGSPETKHPTNVVHLTRAIASFGYKPASGSPSAQGERVEQIVFYDWGLGTEADKYLSAITGAGIDKNIQDCYRFLVHNYEKDDELFFFGFSRGAYTVRSLAGLLRNAGIVKSLHADRIPQAYSMYRRRGKSASPNSLTALNFRRLYSHADRIPISFIGVWDTVGTLGIPAPFWGSLNKRSFLFHDTALSSSVNTARHALALDEYRSDFSPCLWQYKKGADLKQCWFVGSHSDVGGGKAETALSNTPLAWLTAEAQTKGLRLNPESDVAKLISDNAYNASNTDNSDTPKRISARIHNSARGLFSARPRTTRELRGSVHASAKDYWEDDVSNYRKTGRTLKKHLKSVGGDWARVCIDS